MPVCFYQITTYNSQWLESGGLYTYDPRSESLPPVVFPLASRSGLLVDPAAGSLRVLSVQLLGTHRAQADSESAWDEGPGPAGLWHAPDAAARALHIEASESSLFSG